MQSLHPYHYVSPTRIDIQPATNLSYSVDRHGEDDDIRYGFGVCGKADREHIQVAEMDFAWLGVVFHIVVTSEQNARAYAAVYEARDSVDDIKLLARELVVRHIHDHPAQTLSILEKIHQASREQGHLETLRQVIAGLEKPVQLALRE